MDLLERAAETDALEALLRRAATAGGNLVLLGGEAGVGKTALVRHLCDRVRDTARVLVGACDALSTPRPLGPLLDVAAAAGGGLARLVAEDAPRPALFRAALDALTAVPPTLFVVEDAHWADEATLDLLRFLGRRIQATRSLLLVTYRDDEVGPGHPLRVVTGDLATAVAVHRIGLAPLSPTAVATLAATSGLDPVALHRRTGGNPFFVTEVLAAGGHGLSATVHDAVLARVARLSPPARSILEAAAVIGARVDPPLLDAIGGLDADAVDECLAGGMLRTEQDVLTFRHELARDAVLAAIPQWRRRRLHAAVLAGLQADPVGVDDLARLAHHAEAAGDREAVLRYAPAAGRRAEELRAGREATAQYARALRVAGGLPDRERMALLEAYARISDLANWGEAAIGPRREMIGLARRLGDRGKEAEHLGWLSISLALEGQHDEAARAAAEAQAALACVPEGVAHAAMFCNQAELAWVNGDLAAAVAWGERAITLAERLGDVERTLLGRNTVGQAWLQAGDEARGHGELERALSLAREAGLDGFVAVALSNLGDNHCRLYRLAEADRYLSEGLAFAIDQDMDSLRWSMVPWLALVRLFQGRWTEATDLAASVLRLPAAMPPDPHDPVTWDVSPATFGIPIYNRIVALLALGRVRTRRGDPGAWDALDEALALAAPRGTFLRIARVRAARAEAAWLAGDRERTAAEARAAFDGPIGHRSPWLVGELAYWLWRSGEPAAVPPGVAEPFALQIGGDWAAAAAAWSARGCPYEAARALAEGDDEAALRRALSEFERLGARPALRAVTRRLHDLGARDIPRGPRPATRTNPAHLTPREAEVLAGLAAGGTNAEIAARLFLSPKTVEHHVSAILAKLGARSRREAVQTAREMGVLPPK